MPSAGIHTWVSRNCMAWVVVSKPASSRTVSAKSARATASAVHRTDASSRRNAMTSAPAAGRNTMKLRSGKSMRAAYRQATTKMAMAAITPAIIATA